MDLFGKSAKYKYIRNRNPQQITKKNEAYNIDNCSSIRYMYGGIGPKNAKSEFS